MRGRQYKMSAKKKPLHVVIRDSQVALETSVKRLLELVEEWLGNVAAVSVNAR